MEDLYKLKYANSTLTYPGWNGFLQYKDPIVYYPITYLSDVHVSLTGDPIYFPESGGGITLNSGYDTYYRISGYDITGGSIVDGKLVPTGPCTIKAVEKVNYFTASGGFEKGTNVSANTYNNGRQVKNIETKYAIVNYTTDNVPTSWYETSNRWKPNDISSYKLSAETKMKFSAGNGSTVSVYCAATGCVVVGSTRAGQQVFDLTVSTNQRNRTAEYDQPFTTTSQNVNYGVSASVQAGNGYNQYATAAYIATGNTGTWTATGIAP